MSPPLISGIFISSRLSPPRQDRRSGGVLSLALARGADRAADGLRKQPGGKFGADQIPADGPTVHVRVRPGG